MGYTNPNFKYNPYGMAPSLEEVLAEETTLEEIEVNNETSR